MAYEVFAAKKQTSEAANLLNRLCSLYDRPIAVYMIPAESHQAALTETDEL